MKNPIATPSSVAARNALGVIATVAAGAAIYWLRDILTPLAMAIFLLIMIDGVKRSVEARTPLNSRMAGIAGARAALDMAARNPAACIGLGPWDIREGAATPLVLLDRDLRAQEVIGG